MKDRSRSRCPKLGFVCHIGQLNCTYNGLDFRNPAAEWNKPAVLLNGTLYKPPSLFRKVSSLLRRFLTSSSSTATTFLHSRRKSPEHDRGVVRQSSCSSRRAPMTAPLACSPFYSHYAHALGELFKSSLYPSHRVEGSLQEQKIFHLPLEKCSHGLSNVQSNELSRRGGF
jgi:hypothetical protein